MGRIFALRHLSLATVVLAVSLLIGLGKFWLQTDQAAVVVLFGVFYLLVGLILYWIRVGLREKLLLCLPGAVFLLPTGKGQLFGLVLTTFLFFEAFAGPSQFSRAQRPFRGVQTLLLLSTALSFTSLGYNLYLLGGLSLLGAGVFATGCWAWQERLKVELSQLD